MTELERLQKALGGRYTLERLLARGGMATVFVASEHHPHRTVAIKVFDPNISARVGEVRFKREIALAGKLTHPGIVPVFAAGELDDGMLYYVMPMIEGETLRQRLDREHQISLDDVALIVRDVADALDHAHRRNIIHRDIKPQNVLLHEGRAFVTDFGIAKAVYEQVSDGVTEEGITVGTPEYMSPEQIRGSSELDVRSDVYSLACMVYEMITGEAPFRGRTTQSVISRQLSDTASPMRVLRGTVPPILDKVVGRALSKSPNDRYASVVDFASAVIKAITPEAVIRFHTPSGFTPRPFPTLELVSSKRRRPLLLVGAGLAAVLTVGVVRSMWRSDPVPFNAKPPRVAVRSVANLTGSPVNEGAVDLLTADLVDHLHHIAGLEVRDRSSSVALRESALTTRQFADSLDVSHVIGSALERSGEGFVLKAYLADSTGTILQSSRSELARDFGTRMRDSVLRSLIRELAAGLPQVIAVTAAGHEHLVGHDQVLNGSRHLATRTVRGLRGAIADFDAAIAMDPAYAEAYAELSKAYSLALAYRYRLPIEPYDAAGRALVAADRAIEIEPDLASGYSARGYIQRLTMAPALTIVASFDTAKQIDPNAADAVGWSAPALVLQGRLDDALSAAHRAIRLDKLSASRRITMAVVSTSLRRYDDAVRSAAAARALAPELGLARAWWARALVLGKRAAECADEDLTPHAGLRALCLREAGRTAEAQVVIDTLRRRHAAGAMADSTFTDVALLEDLATYFASAGDAAGATEWMERAYERAPNGIVPEVLESDLFTPVRANPVFSQALARARVRVSERLAIARETARRQLAGSVALVTAGASRNR